MKVHFIFENHEQDKNLKKYLVNNYSDKNTIIASEGCHDLLLTKEGYGLEDIVYQIYTEIAALYLAILENNWDDVSPALYNLRAMYAIKDHKDWGFMVESFVDDGSEEHYVDRKADVAALIERLFALTPKNFLTFERGVFDILKTMQAYVLAYKNNVVYLSCAREAVAMHFASLESLDITCFERFSLLLPNDRLRFTTVVLRELRDVAIHHNMLKLAEQFRKSDIEHLVVILGENHSLNESFQQKIIQMCLGGEFTIHLYKNYRDLFSALNIQTPEHKIQFWFRGLQRKKQTEDLRLSAAKGL